MAEVKKARLFLRRGLDSDRLTTILCEGELGYSTDAERVVVGDGSTLGGISLGSKMFTVADGAHTSLTDASTNGIAFTGDLALSSTEPYTNAAGVSITPISTFSNTKILTGGDPSCSDHWAFINQCIPYCNLCICNDDISGDKIHGGTISGPITIDSTCTAMYDTGGSGCVVITCGAANEKLYLCGVAFNAQNGAVPTSNIYPLGITCTGQVTALTGVASFTNKAIEHRTYYMYTRSPFNITSTACYYHGSASGSFYGAPNPSSVKTFIHSVWADAVTHDQAQVIWFGSGKARAISQHSSNLVDAALVVNLCKYIDTGSSTDWCIPSYRAFSESSEDYFNPSSYGWCCQNNPS